MGPNDPGRDSETRALYRISSIGTPETDLAAAVREILRAVPDVIPCELPLLMLHDPDVDDLRCFSSRGEEGPRVSLAEPGIIRRIFHVGKGEVVNDVLSDIDGGVLVDRFQARQLVAAPLITGDQRLGVVAAVNSRSGAFTEGDLRLMSVLADRASLNLNAVELRAAFDRQGRELEGLHRLSRLLISTESLEHVIGESLRAVTDLVDCQRVMVLLHDEDTDCLRVQPPTIGIEKEKVAHLELPLGEPSLASTVFRTSTPLVSNDTAKDKWVAPVLRDLLDISNVLVVPLTSGGQTLGVLEAINSLKGYFDDEDLRFTTLLGGRIGSVIGLSRARERERALVQKLREADRTKSDFVSILAHELKSPMTTILGFGQMLKEHWTTMEDEKREQLIGIVHRETERLARMVSDLLDVSRMESGTLRYEMEPMSISDLIDNILTVHTSVKAKHELVVEVPPDLPKVKADKERLRQVILNLLTNATRYSPEGTSITVTADVVVDGDNDVVRVGVRDEGIGIGPGDADRIFSKFAMLPKPAWTKKGTGLGLFITKTIVDAHDGRLWVESQVGEGSRFYFTVPVAADAT